MFLYPWIIVVDVLLSPPLLVFFTNKRRKGELRFGLLFLVFIIFPLVRSHLTISDKLI